MEFNNIFALVSQKVWNLLFQSYWYWDLLDGCFIELSELAFDFEPCTDYTNFIVLSMKFEFEQQCLETKFLCSFHVDI